MGSALAAGIALGAQETCQEILRWQKSISNRGSVLGTDVKHGTSTNHIFYRIQEAFRKLFLDTINVMPPRIIH